MDSKLTAGFQLRLIVAAVTGCIFLGPSEASAQQQTMVCSAANFLAQPGAATAPTMLAYSTLSFTNPNPGASLVIDSITVFDRNGQQLCAYAEGNPLPVKAFDPARFFDFTEALGPNQTLNIMTARLPCVPWPVVSTASANDVMGTLTVRVSWRSDREGKSVASLIGGVSVVYADIATGRYDGVRTLQCSEVWP